MSLEENEKEQSRQRARQRAARPHQGAAHWHVERRSTVIICGSCDARGPIWKAPRYCPECEAGKL